MKRMMRFLLLCIFALMMVSSVFAQEGPTRVSDQVTGGRIVFDTTFVRFYGMSGWNNVPGHKQYVRNLSSWLQHGQDGSQNILFYNTYRGYGYSNSYFQANAPVVLRANGDTVTVTTRTATPVLTEALLSEYDQLWIINGQANSSGTFSAAELDAVAAFLNDGHGVLLISDHANRPGWDKTWATDVGQVAGLFGVSYQGYINRYYPMTVSEPDFDTGHPIWDGVNAVWGGTDSEIVTENPAVQIIAAPNGSPMVAVLEVEAPKVDIDIKPNSCPNPLNVRNHGVIPVAILGSEDVDVNMIDIASLSLEGVSPIRVAVEDVASPPANGCSTAGADGYDDLVLKFDKGEVVEAIHSALGRTVSDGEELILSLTADLSDSKTVAGEDVVVIRKKGK
jgi:hypothetical protein